MDFYYELLNSYRLMKKRKFSISIDEAKRAFDEYSDQDLEAAHAKALAALKSGSSPRPNVTIEAGTGVAGAAMMIVKGVRDYGNNGVGFGQGSRQEKNRNPQVSRSPQSSWMKFVELFLTKGDATGGKETADAAVEASPLQDLVDQEGSKVGQKLSDICAQMKNSVKNIADDSNPVWRKEHESYCGGNDERSLEHKLSQVGSYELDEETGKYTDVGAAGLNREDAEDYLNTISTVMKFGEGTDTEEDCVAVNKLIKRKATTYAGKTAVREYAILNSNDTNDGIYVKNLTGPVQFSLNRAAEKCAEGGEFEVIQKDGTPGAQAQNNWIGKQREVLGAALTQYNAIIENENLTDAQKSKLVKGLRSDLKQSFMDDLETAEESLKTIKRKSAWALEDDALLNGLEPFLEKFITKEGFTNFVAVVKTADDRVVSKIQKAMGKRAPKLNWAQQVGLETGGGKRGDVERGVVGKEGEDSHLRAAAAKLGLDPEKAVHSESFADKLEACGGGAIGTKKGKAASKCKKTVKRQMETYGVTKDNASDTYVHTINIGEKMYVQDNISSMKFGEVNGTEALDNKATRGTGKTEDEEYYDDIMETLYDNKKDRTAATKRINKYSKELQAQDKKIDSILPATGKTSVTFSGKTRTVSPNEVVTQLAAARKAKTPGYRDADDAILSALQDNFGKTVDMRNPDTQKRVNEIIKRVLKTHKLRTDAKKGKAGARERLAMDVMNSGGSVDDELSHTVHMPTGRNQLIRHNDVALAAAQGILGGSPGSRSTGTLLWDIGGGNSNITLENPNDPRHRLSFGSERTKSKNALGEVDMKTRYKLDVSMSWIHSIDKLPAQKRREDSSVNVVDFLKAQASMIQELLVS